jgi:hypothetical protein
METTTGSAEHWDHVYGRGDATRSWFQLQAVWSLQMLDRGGIDPSDSVIDLGGGSSPLTAALLARGHSDLTVLDLSLVGMRAAQQRLGDAAERVQWLVGDVRTWRPPRRYLVWHDRALFHFVITDQDRDAYLKALESASVPGRTISIFGTFASDGPRQCSGLPVARYSAAELAAAIGDSWQSIDDGRELHTTPTSVIQPFTWTAFRRRS